ncbi:integral peroxisomal membrane peroxin-domain-containing protein [Leucosporidium creatinivorum]|uniref:Integral peroxisomal membrane peroxin-domain-containing protein n=1 Tax=Leucosporidium creatinivorum TaxID=106004 RepID=A0A1Y2FJD4_9BASI|nr:integral peroxisomal membrane peroxin-domain-containing protein [Leucosporidium creatinivorum]
MAESKPSPDSPATPGRLANLKAQLGTVDDLIMSTVLKSASVTPGTGGKEPLSLQQTSTNFRRFVAKSGPIFVAQDAAEAVLRWEDGSKTVFFGVVWAFLCWYPLLLLLLPNVVVASILLYNYQARVPPSSPDSPTPGPTPAPPAEGSVDYLANLHGIQIMMGRLSDLSDFGRSFVPYLTWRDERTSLVLLQLSVLSGVFTFLVAPFIPWRFVFIALGEAALLAGHPIAKTLASEAAPFLQASGKRFGVKAARLLEDDALLDEELDSELIEVERFEVESRQDGAWVPDVTSGGELPKGFKWLKVGDWVVDVLYAGGQVDEGEPSLGDIGRGAGPNGRLQR